MFQCSYSSCDPSNSVNEAAVWSWVSSIVNNTAVFTCYVNSANTIQVLEYVSFSYSEAINSIFWPILFSCITFMVLVGHRITVYNKACSQARPSTPDETFETPVCRQTVLPTYDEAMSVDATVARPSSTELCVDEVTGTSEEPPPAYEDIVGNEDGFSVAAREIFEHDGETTPRMAETTPRIVEVIPRTGETTPRLAVMASTMAVVESQDKVEHL